MNPDTKLSEKTPAAISDIGLEAPELKALCKRLLAIFGGKIYYMDACLHWENEELLGGFVIKFVGGSPIRIETSGALEWARKFRTASYAFGEISMMLFHSTRESHIDRKFL